MAKMNIFNSIQLPRVGSNKFDLSHDVKMSFKMGELVPTACLEAIPGDQFEINVENLLRFAPLVSPVMHKVRVTTHYFFVPNRILWPQWEDFITGNADIEHPYIRLQLDTDLEQAEVGSIADYLGVPTGIVGGAADYLDVSALPFAAYLKIYDEYYRDQNLIAEAFEPLVPGDNTLVGAYLDMFGGTPYRRAWQHDYFTAALPFAQKGDSVQLPLTQNLTVPVELQPNTGVAKWVDASDGTDAAAGTPNLGTGGFTRDSTNDEINYDPSGTLTVDVQADAVDITTVRRAFRLQEFLERAARGGTRYTELILSMFDKKSSDARLQRPEYIGGSKQNMVISEVLATAETTAAGVSVGTMAGHGISVGGGNTFRFTCEEHGFVIGIINVQPDTAYQQGLHRRFSRRDRLDYPWPTFANIGEQEVLNKELYVNNTTNAVKDTVFGYVPRYAEMKYEPSRVAGEMRSSLDFWHLGRIFSSQPQLNENFINCIPDTRIFAIEDPNVDHIYSHIFNNISVRRKLPRFGTPTI